MQAERTVPPRIPGIFLSHDRHLSAAVFCLEQYARVWPGCPIEFFVPANSLSAEQRIQREASHELTIKIVRCEAPICSTLKALLEATGDADWIFWCSSDRYPILALDAPLDAVAAQIAAGGEIVPPHIDAIRIVRWKDADAIDASAEPIMLGGRTFSTAPTTHIGFWHPQFVRRSWLGALVERLGDDATLDDLQLLIEQQLKANEERLNKRAIAICSNALMKVEEPIKQGKATINYAARQARRRGDIDGLEIEGVSVAYSCVRAHQSNPYWQRANIEPSAALNAPMKGKVSVRVVSPGGVGSKQISAWLNREKAPLARSHAHSHTRIPPTSIGSDEKCLYVFGDPRNVVLSIFNRRQIRHEGHGFEAVNPVRTQPAPQFAMLHAANLQSSSEHMTEDWDLTTYLSHGFDAFRLEEHFDFWLSADAAYEVVFVRYETLWRHAETLGAYLGTKDEPPTFRARTSDWTLLDEATRSQMDKLYGSFARRLKTLPDLFRVRGRETRLLDGTLFQFTDI